MPRCFFQVPETKAAYKTILPSSLHQNIYNNLDIFNSILKKRRRKKSDWYSFSSNTHKLLSSWIIFTLMTSNAREKTLVCTCANKSSSCVSDLASSFYVRSSRVISWLFSTNDLKCVLSLILMSVIWLNRS